MFLILYSFSCIEFSYIVFDIINFQSKFKDIFGKFRDNYVFASKIYDNLFYFYFFKIYNFWYNKYKDIFENFEIIYIFASEIVIYDDLFCLFF